MSKPSTFDDAFKILDQAINDQQPPDLRALVDNEIQFFKTIVRNEATNSLEELGRGRDELNGLMKEFSALGVGHATEVAESVDKHVRENPLLYIGVAAAGALAIGFLLSRPPRPQTFSAADSETDSFGGVHGGRVADDGGDGRDGLDPYSDPYADNDEVS